MNLFELLEQFKHIEPDAAFSASSKRAILAQAELKESLAAPRLLLRILEAGAAVALTGFFILILSGALSTSKFAPAQLSAIDPQSIRAEAQAIDIQIRLANVTYQGGSNPESTVSSAHPALIAGSPSEGASGAAAASSSTASGNATSSATSTVSIDQALQSLAQ